jgi:hypothetical protein
MHFAPLSLALLTSFAGFALSTTIPQPRPGVNNDTGIFAVEVPSTNLATSSFVRPGVFISKAGLDFIRKKVNSGTEPWASTFTSMLKNDLASLSRNPKPRETVECGPVSKETPKPAGIIRTEPNPETASSLSLVHLVFVAFRHPAALI